MPFNIRPIKFLSVIIISGDYNIKTNMFTCDPNAAAAVSCAEKKRACNFATGRRIIGLVAILTGLQLWTQGVHIFETHLDRLRVEFYP